MQTIAATCLLAGFTLLLFAQSIQGQCFCGNPTLPASSDRIINGTVITPDHKYPWLARIIVFINSATLFCGGSLLSEKWVITSASCLHDATVNTTSGSQILVILGKHNFGSGAGQLPHFSYAKQYISHPMFNFSSIFNHDVALIELISPVNYETQPHIRPICLPTANVTEHQNLTIAGWGLTAENMPPPLIPNEIMLNVSSNPICNTSAVLNQDTWPIRNVTMFCALTNLTQGHICDGDYGGPAMTNTSGIFYLSGVITFEQERGRCTANETEPGVFTNIIAPVIYDWINTTTMDAGTTCAEN